MEQPINNQEEANHSVRKKSNSWIYLIIIALLLGTNIYLYLQKNETADALVEKQGQLQEADTTLIQLQNEYNASLARLDELTGKNAQLDKQLKDKDSEIEKTKARIRELLTKSNATKAELLEAKNLITGLNTRISDYEEQIAVLKQENSNLVVERDSVVKNNADLEGKIDLAKVLHASEIRMKGVNLVRSGRKEKETGKAKRVDLLRITFNIDENRIAESGEKTLQICIVDPANELLSNAAFGSGSFETADGKTKYYSVSKIINLQAGQPLTDINVDWQQTADYTKGIYTVEIYHKGYLIGKGMVSLR